MASASEGQREGERLVWNRGFRRNNKRPLKYAEKEAEGVQVE